MMRLERLGGVLIVTAAVAAGCTAGPGASALPSASANARPFASSAPSVEPATTDRPSSRPSASGPILPFPLPTPTPAPVLLEATGTTDARIKGGPLTFTASAGGRASCESLPDSRTVGDLTALDLGQLGSGTLRAQWPVPEAGTAVTTVNSFIDGGDLPEGSYQPFWSGHGTVATVGDGGATGTLTFAGLELEIDASLKPGQTAPPDAAAWPATLSGTITWSCAPWPEPISSDAPAASIAP